MKKRKITPHKGGRVRLMTFNVTEEERRAIILAKGRKSLADWIVEQANRHPVKGQV